MSPVVTRPRGTESGLFRPENVPLKFGKKLYAVGQGVPEAPKLFIMLTCLARGSALKAPLPKCRSVATKNVTSVDPAPVFAGHEVLFGWQVGSPDFSVRASKFRLGEHEGAVPQARSPGPPQGP